jgi:DNA (cytosine-5)-methyltransferase 1
MIGVEIFSGAGGMSVGASMAGIKTKFAVEIDKYAAETFQHNHKAVQMFNDDICKLKEIPLKKNKQPTILFGGPPCQGFSLSNQRTRNKDNEKNWLFQEFVRLTKQWKPDWFVLENVSGILKTEGGLIWEQIVDEFNKIGYTTNFKLLNSSDFGVPQKRNRVFLVGSLHGITFQFPEALNSDKITVKDAIHDLPILRNGDSFEHLIYNDNALSNYAKRLRFDSEFAIHNNVTRNSQLIIDRYKHIPQGGNWQNIPAELMTNYKDYTRCHGGIYHRLSNNEPSVVIGNYRKNMLIHPTQDRGLSVREAARLQSFPDSFIFKGDLGNQQQQVGNAVPPFLAKEVFMKILQS